MSQTYTFGHPIVETIVRTDMERFHKKKKKSPFLFVGKHQQGLVKEGLELEEVNKVLR